MILLEEQIKNKLLQKELLIVKLRVNPELIDELERDINKLNAHIELLIEQARKEEQ